MPRVVGIVVCCGAAATHSSFWATANGVSWKITTNGASTSVTSAWSNCRPLGCTLIRGRRNPPPVVGRRPRRLFRRLYGRRRPIRLRWRPCRRRPRAWASSRSVCARWRIWIYWPSVESGFPSTRICFPGDGALISIAYYASHVLITLPRRRRPSHFDPDSPRRLPPAAPRLRSPRPRQPTGGMCLNQPPWSAPTPAPSRNQPHPSLRAWRRMMMSKLSSNHPVLSKFLLPAVRGRSTSLTPHRPSARCSTTCIPTPCHRSARIYLPRRCCAPSFNWPSHMRLMACWRPPLAACTRCSMVAMPPRSSTPPPWPPVVVVALPAFRVSAKQHIIAEEEGWIASPMAFLTPVRKTSIAIP